MTDLHAQLAERIAAKIADGKRPSKADLEWLAALEPAAPPSSSVTKSRNAKGDVQIDVKAYHADPLEAERISDLIFDRQRARYPMSDGTVGSPMSDDAKGAKA